MKSVDPSGYYVIGTKDGITKIFSGPHPDRWTAVDQKSRQWSKDWSWTYSVEPGTSLINKNISTYNDLGLVPKTPQSGLETVTSAIANYQAEKYRHELEMQQRQIAEQKAREERARNERIALFNRTHKNTNTAYNYDSNDKRQLKLWQRPAVKPDTRASSAVGHGLLYGGIGAATGMGIGKLLGRKIPAIRSVDKAMTAGLVAGASAGLIGGITRGINKANKKDELAYQNNLAERKEQIDIYSKRVAESKLDKIDPAVYYVIEYNPDAFNRGVHKVLRGFDKKTDAQAYRNDLRSRGYEAIINKGSTLLAKGVDIKGI